MKSLTSCVSSRKKEKSFFCLFSLLCALLPHPPKTTCLRETANGLGSGFMAQTNIMIPPVKTYYKKIFLHNLQLF